MKYGRQSIWRSKMKQAVPFQNMLAMWNGFESIHFSQVGC